ncbi:MAG: peptidyl-prolyl cis-trans isomerase, partial [Planctomycetes bacterium]|nr:peptidyl-prolyl cis-trans isomerase [Planctomycetota bacterium]
MLQAKIVPGVILFFAVAMFPFWNVDLAKGQVADPAQVADSQPAELDPNRVIARVGDQELLGWQVDVLVANDLGTDVNLAANEWIRVLLRDQEARRRGLHESREAQFRMAFRQKYDLGIFTFEDILMKNIPEVTDEEVKARYDQDIDRYVQPMEVDIQRLVVPQKTVAEMVATEARKPDVEFDSLVEQWDRANNKATKGYMYGAKYDFLKEMLGARVTDEIRLSGGPGIVGPVMGQIGYEVIKIHKYIPGRNYPFEQMKDNIHDGLQSENYRNSILEIDRNLEKETDV